MTSDYKNVCADIIVKSPAHELSFSSRVRRSDERRKIVAVLKKAGDELTPAAIAKLAGMKPVNVRVLLGKMLASGEVSQLSVGSYTVPCPKPL